MHVLSAVSPAEAQRPKVLYHPLVTGDTKTHQPIRAHGSFLRLFLEKQHPNPPSAFIHHMESRAQLFGLSSDKFHTIKSLQSDKQGPSVESRTQVCHMVIILLLKKKLLNVYSCLNELCSTVALSYLKISHSFDKKKY